MTAYAHKDDCTILRGETAKSVGRDNGMAKLIDEEGDLLFSFPDAWTDDQIWHALLFVNAKFDTAILIGIERARTQMRMVIGLDT